MRTKLNKNCFVFGSKKRLNCLLKWRHHFAFPPATEESSRCSTPFSAFDVLSVLDLGRSDKCAVVSHRFICISLMTMMLNIFANAYWPSVYLLGWGRGLKAWVFGLNGFAHLKIGLFTFLVSSFKGVYTFWISALSDVPWQIFFPVCGLFSHSFDIIFYRTEILNFNQVELISYYFNGLYLWCCT